MYDETDSIVDGLEELMKISDKKIVSQEGMICLGLIVLAGVFFNCPGTGDVEIWNSWMDYAGGGIIEGYIRQTNMYPPLALFVQICLKKICPILSNFSILRLTNIFFLLVTVFIIQVLYKNYKVTIVSFISLILSVNIGYLDIEMCPFIILSFYYLKQNKYIHGGIFFALLCLVKYQPLIILPFIFIYFIHIFDDGHGKWKLIVRWKDVLQFGLPGIILGGGISIIYKGEPIAAMIRGLASGRCISANALNFGWVLQFCLQKLYTEQYGALSSGEIRSIDAASQTILSFRYAFILIYIFTMLLLLLAKKRDVKLLLQCCIIGYTAYFLYNSGVHENHLFLGMVLMVMLYLHEPTKNNWYKMYMYILIVNVNLLVFYGISGKGPGFSRIINSSFDPTLALAAFNVFYLSVTIIQIMYEMMNNENMIKFYIFHECKMNLKNQKDIDE